MYILRVSGDSFFCIVPTEYEDAEGTFLCKTPLLECICTISVLAPSSLVSFPSEFIYTFYRSVYFNHLSFGFVLWIFFPCIGLVKSPEKSFGSLNSFIWEENRKLEKPFALSGQEENSNLFFIEKSLQWYFFVLPMLKCHPAGVEHSVLVCFQAKQFGSSLVLKTRGFTFTSFPDENSCELKYMNPFTPFPDYLSTMNLKLIDFGFSLGSPKTSTLG